MNNQIHETAKVGKNTTIGIYTVIDAEVQIGENCTIGNNVTIYEGTKIGQNVRIDDNTVIGKQPMRAKRSIFQESKKMQPTEICDNCMIGAVVVIYAGAKINNNILIADLASIRENVSIGEYTIVGRGVTIENYCNVGKKCKLETNVYITAYSEVGDYCFIAPGVVTTNDNFMGRSEERFKHFKGVTVKNGGRIGGRAVILPGIEIGEDAVVGAGSVVTRNVPAKTVVVGVPAKFFRNTPEDQLLENQGWD
ncbi:N-acetyltransferase [candidate division KSB1 bacterium]|nr:N-acetyltransferase [candidate division KSB1 bacterium]